MTNNMKIIPTRYVLKNNKIIGSATVCKITDVKKHDEPCDTTPHRKIKRE